MLSRGQNPRYKEKKKQKKLLDQQGRRSTAADKRTIEISHNLGYPDAMNKRKGVQLQ